MCPLFEDYKQVFETPTSCVNSTRGMKASRLFRYESMQDLGDICASIFARLYASHRVWS